MGTRIEVRGIILGAEADSEWLSDYIDKGLVTPESRVRKALATADTTEPLELYVNSNGGSVFAGHEMANAIADWAETHGQQVNVTVGALAASAATDLVLNFAPVKLHANSLLMFHSARTEQFGGPGAMLDAADLLGKINAMQTQALVNRFGLDPSRVAEWYSEGRMGWLDAAEAVDSGIASAAAAEDAERVDLTDEVLNQLIEPDGLPLAALIDELPAMDPDDMAAIDENMEALVSIIGQICEAAKAPDPTDHDAVIAHIAGLHAKIDAAYDEGLAAGKAESVKDTAPFTEQIERLTAETGRLQAEWDAAEKRLLSLTRGMELPSGKPPAPATDGYWSAVYALVEDGYSKDQAQLTVQADQPALYAEMLKQAQKKDIWRR